MTQKNEPQEYRDLEKQANELAAQVSADMLKRPGARWVLGPIRKAFKWVAAQCDRSLKEDGWR